jgi:hypothetical protein
MIMKTREKLAKTGSGLGTDNVMQETLKKGGVFCAGNRTCDPSREFEGKCGGLYVASVMHGPHTNNEVRQPTSVHTCCWRRGFEV